MNRFERDAWWTLISMVHCVPGTLTVNVSVLLLSLASPDESSLVIEHFSLDNHFIMPKTRNKKTMHAWHIFTSLGHTRGAPKPLKYIINEFINDLSLPLLFLIDRNTRWSSCCNNNGTTRDYDIATGRNMNSWTRFIITMISGCRTRTS